ncbi:MAG: hypothetical protein QOE05_3522 [Actinomycetota bacterium]|jgi:hypothetical protein|nr:hypothetical protein [Actinomycetota bacterium]
MTFPAATFAAVAPPPDGLALAFTSARRRRNSKAAVSAFGGAVAIASVLSFLAPPGQSLVQEPAVPAHGGLLPGLPDAPRHGAPAPATRPVATSALTVPGARGTSTHPLRAAESVHSRPSAFSPPGACSASRALACVVIHPPAPGGPTMHGAVCPSAATVTVEYDAPPAGPTRMSVKRTVEVGSCAS